MMALEGQFNLLFLSRTKIERCNNNSLKIREKINHDGSHCIPYTIIYSPYQSLYLARLCRHIEEGHRYQWNNVLFYFVDVGIQLLM
jgi:hypothetical protein